MQNLHATLLIVYCVGVSIGSFITMGAFILKDPPEDPADCCNCFTWIPTIFKRNLCLRPFCPLVALLPALLWPLVVASVVLASVALLTLDCVDRLVSLVFPNSTTTCCGYPLGRNWADSRRPSSLGRSPANRDVELGTLAHRRVAVADFAAPARAPVVAQQPKPVAQPAAVFTVAAEVSSPSSSRDEPAPM